MSEKSALLRALVNERLKAVAEEIFALFESTVADYEEELRRCKEENHKKLLEAKQLLTHETTQDAQTHETLLDETNSYFNDTEGQKLDMINVKSECSDWTENGDMWGSAAGPSVPAEEERETEMEEEEIEENRDTSEDEHQCCICNQGFVDAQSLKRHMDFHMKDVEPLNPSKQKEKSVTQSRPQTQPHSTQALFPSSSFICPFCKRAFLRKSDLRHHILTHTGEKPFACSYCNRRFNRKSNLYRHYRNHAKNKFP